MSGEKVGALGKNVLKFAASLGILAPEAEAEELIDAWGFSEGIEFHRTLQWAVASSNRPRGAGEEP
jgi:hypothetical protein